MMNETVAVQEEVSMPVPVMTTEQTDVAPPMEQAPDMTADAPAKAKPKGFEDVDSVLKALADQDEILKTMKQQISDLLATNAMFKKSLKGILQGGSKVDELETELAATKKKLHVIKQFLG